MKRVLLLVILLGSELHAISFKIHEASKEKKPFIIGLTVLRQMAEAQPLSDSEKQELLDVLASYDALDWSKALSNSRDTYNAIWAKADPINWEQLAKDYGTITKVRQKAPTSTGKAAPSSTPTQPAPANQATAPTTLEEAFEQIAKTKAPDGISKQTWDMVNYSLQARERKMIMLQNENLTTPQLEIIIDTLPQIIVAQIERLDLSVNQLTALPDTIQKFTHLHSLDIYQNQLTELPQAIQKLTMLKTLVIDRHVIVPTLRSEVLVMRG